MQSSSYHTWNEINSQPAAWAATIEQLRGQAGELRALYRDGGYESVVFAGCGSPYYLALAAASALQELAGIPARGVPASELWLNPRAAYASNRKTLLVALSRSGETTETIRACQSFRERGAGEVLTLSCYPDRPLTALGALNLVLPAGQEQSLAQTRAFTTLHLAALYLAALWAGRQDTLGELERLPEIGRRLLDSYGDLASRIGRDGSIDRFYFLGSGPRYGLACELSLKMKEMSLSQSEPFHVLEFRHGPQAMVTPSTLLVGLIGEQSGAHELAVLDDMRALGGRALAIGEQGLDASFDSGLSQTMRDILYLPVGQLLAFERALHNGLDPDRPTNLSAVVKLDHS
jgi:glucosamine--fructose-6-phosphate aminotransferase (isomerizing)